MSDPIEWLHVLRGYELERIRRHLRSGSRLLELGGGTGAQARALVEGGFNVTSIDLPNSNYADARAFPIIDYDGRHFPVGDRAVDVVFSSNTLEHVVDLAAIHTETRRVLRDEGYAVHVMPSATWRLWTIVGDYWRLLCEYAGWARRQAAAQPAPAAVTPGDPLPGTPDEREAPRPPAIQRIVRRLRAELVPERHGERGSAFTEVWLFSRAAWLRHFAAHGYEIETVEPIGLFYTGHSLVGRRLDLTWRRRLAKVLGSACVLYVVRPTRRGT